MEKMERLEGEYKKVRKALEFVIELVEDVGEELENIDSISGKE